MAPKATYRVLTETEWCDQRERHKKRFEHLVQPHSVRRSRHIKNATADFLFEYYAFRPSHLKRWSPGIGVLLTGEKTRQLLADDHFVQMDGGIAVSSSNLSEKLISGTEWILQLLRSTQNREAHFGCFGLHEWAMLYKSNDPRHAQLRLRVSKQELAEVVEAGPLSCSHYDAYRFFTPAAQPLNAASLCREDMTSCEQPGCLHANMDVYRWAFKRYPWIGSDLIMDGFELALEIRNLDMAASPYDLQNEGIIPVPVESAAGRKIYARMQRSFSERAAVLRERLISDYQRLLSGPNCRPDAFAIAHTDS